MNEVRGPLSLLGVAGGRFVVTGAGSGIGQATATRLLHNGAEVVAVDLKEGPLSPLGSSGATVLVADVTRSADRARVVEASGTCDGLVNCAGVIRLIPPSETREADWDAVVGVNAEALLFLSLAMADQLRPGGAIVSMSSVAAIKAATPEAMVYAASKAAVISLTRSLAVVLAPKGVRVNAILPGIVDTPMQTQLIEDVAKIRGGEAGAVHADRVGTIPLGRSGSADEIATTVLFLLGPNASYITGQTLVVDGGFSIT
ncbi:MAG TPA: SDR family oxidoreductase [Acidimicrobiales bacterium]|nr:SDR family oxidoreductase [Acidimicrobiales bacterium]